MRTIALRPSHVLLGVLLLLTVAFAGCGADGTSSETLSDPATGSTETPAASGGDAGDSADPELAWLETELTDVQTGKTFRISDFKGRPVLVKSFAVW